MAQRPKRVVAELNKVWDQVVLKGKALNQEGETLIKNVGKAVVQDGEKRIQNAYQLSERTKVRFRHAMSTYENFIGIREVKAAHERVLNAENKFAESQEDRREAQRELAEIQKELNALRGDIERTGRGDHRYLELIKREIDIVRDERSVRLQFQELEKRERELFAELSSALRASHEKERAQNEKTKYWSILGSIIGAFLGILATTVNSQMKHRQTREILSQTSDQVNHIEKAVQGLALLLGGLVETERGDASSVALKGKLSEAVAQLTQHESRLEGKTEAILKATGLVQTKLNQLLVLIAKHEEVGLDPGIKVPPSKNPDKLLEAYKDYSGRDKDFWITTVGVIVLGFLCYRYS